MPDSNIPITAGTGTTVDTYQIGTGDHRQYVIPGDHGGYNGRFGTFRIPGRAATAHNLCAIHNATGSTVVAEVKFVGIDVYQTVIKAVTVPPPTIRLSRFTGVPTNGSAATKAPADSNLSSSSSVTVWQDASADGTSSTTALTITPGSTVTQEFAPRMITAAGYEMSDRIELLTAGSIILRANEGLVLNLVSPAGTSEPTTDMFIANMLWEEYTP